MRLVFEHRIFTIHGKYDVYDVNGKPVYRVSDILTRKIIGHSIDIKDMDNQVVGHIEQRWNPLFTTFDLYQGPDKQLVGRMKKELNLFRHKFLLKEKNWHVVGNLLLWDFKIVDGHGNVLAIAEKRVRVRETFTLDIEEKENEVPVLLFALAMMAFVHDKIQAKKRRIKLGALITILIRGLPGGKSGNIKNISYDGTRIKRSKRHL